MKKEKIFILIFIIMLLFPIYGRLTEKNIELNGVTEDSGLELGGVSQVMDGTTQKNLGNYFEDNFGGRSFLIKVRSQLLYTCFGISPNKNVIVGKNQYLFEPEYIYRELNIWQPATDEYYDDLILKLENLQNICKEHDKELYIFVTPSKASFCKDRIPDEYFKLENKAENDYQRFIRHIKNSDLMYFDSHDYINNHKSDMSVPLFYSTGIHWSRPWGYKCAIEFSKFISSNGKYQLGSVSQDIQPSKDNEPVLPDADLYSSLNLFAAPNRDIYYVSTPVLTSESDCPKVFLRGGSFMGQSLVMLGDIGAWDCVAHYENNYCFTNSGLQTFSAFDAYSEFDNMGDLIAESDILVLEVNEAAVSNMSWGFIDYLLENQQMFE